MLDFLKEEYDGLKQRIALKQTYQFVFESPQGKQVLHDIIRRSQLFSVSPSETVAMARQAGRRDLALEILTMLRMDDEAAKLRLLQERDNPGETR